MHKVDERLDGAIAELNAAAEQNRQELIAANTTKKKPKQPNTIDRSSQTEAAGKSSARLHRDGPEPIKPPGHHFVPFDDSVYFDFDSQITDNAKDGRSSPGGSADFLSIHARGSQDKSGTERAGLLGGDSLLLHATTTAEGADGPNGTYGRAASAMGDVGSDAAAFHDSSERALREIAASLRTGGSAIYVSSNQSKKPSGASPDATKRLRQSSKVDSHHEEVIEWLKSDVLAEVSSIKVSAARRLTAMEAAVNGSAVLVDDLQSRLREVSSLLNTLNAEHSSTFTAHRALKASYEAAESKLYSAMDGIVSCVDTCQNGLERLDETTRSNRVSIEENALRINNLFEMLLKFMRVS
jgi:hypothetical protein